jgi:hypothetical protein
MSITEEQYDQISNEIDAHDYLSWQPCRSGVKYQPCTGFS